MKRHLNNDSEENKSNEDIFSEMNSVNQSCILSSDERNLGKKKKTEENLIAG